jgi:uncharacterized glyoxalase superfamily protein PhnB
MRTNRSMPAATVIPVLSYPDVRAAVEWLELALGFVERLQIGTHRSQLAVGDGFVVVAAGAASTAARDHSVMVRVADVDQHCARARAHGARIVQEPTSFPYGERQYTALDLAGHAWTFSESIEDVDPVSWGGRVHGSGPDKS